MTCEINYPLPLELGLNVDDVDEGSNEWRRRNALKECFDLAEVHDAAETENDIRRAFGIPSRRQTNPKGKACFRLKLESEELRVVVAEGESRQHRQEGAPA